MVSLMNTAQLPSVERIWKWLAEVADPEIPVISIVELGIVRDVNWQGTQLIITVTPTYSGCPATGVIKADIESALRAHGIDNLRVTTQLSPAWTTDWMSEQAREKLRDYGIAPPAGGCRAAAASGVSNLDVVCPRCGASDTERVSEFGSTPCKALYRCRQCMEPFDYFKVH